MVTSEGNFLMERVGGDAIVGKLGPYKSVKCFALLEVGKESTVKSF